MPAPHHSGFTGRLPFLPLNQQRQSTEDKKVIHYMDNTLRIKSFGHNETLSSSNQIYEGKRQTVFQCLYEEMHK